MDKSQLLKVLGDNGVKFNSLLLSESVAGYPTDEYEAYAAKLYGDLCSLAERGVQCGFGGVKDEIFDLSNLVAMLINGTGRVSVNFNKMEAERAKILKRVSADKGFTMDMKEQLLKNLEDCIKAARTIKGFRADNEDLCRNLDESVTKLEEIKKALLNVADASSKQAAAYQATVFEILMDWRSDAGRYNCYSDTVELLDEALATVKEWQKLTAEVKRGDKAKPYDSQTRKGDYYVYKEDFDDICGIVRAALATERTKGLKSTLDEFRKQTEKQYDVAKLEGEIAELESDYFSAREELAGKLQQVEAQTDATLIAYQNGEIDAITAESKCADLDEQKTDLERSLDEEKEDFDYRMSGLRTDLSDAREATRSRNRVAREFEGFLTKLEAYRESDPAKFVLFCKSINFDDIYDTLTGRLDSKGVDEVFTSIETIFTVVERDIVKQRENTGRFTDIRFKTRRAREERLLAEREKQNRKEEQRKPLRVPAESKRSASNEEAASKSLEERLKKRGLGAANKGVNQEKPKEGLDGIIPVDNDDK